MSASVDHVIGIKQGGNPLDAGNLRPAHLTCNVAKGNRARGNHNSRDW